MSTYSAWPEIAFKAGRGKYAIPEPQFLLDLPILHGITPEVAKIVSQNALLVQWLSGTEIYGEGDYVDLAFLLLHGEIRLDSAAAMHSPRFTSQPQTGARATIATLPENAIFGELTSAQPHAQIFTAVAQTPCETLVLRGEAVRHLRRVVKRFDRLTGIEYINFAALKRHWLFVECGDATVARLALHARLRSYAAGEIIAPAGESAMMLYLILAGYVRVEDSGTSLGFCAAQDIVGAREFLQKRGPRNFSHTFAAHTSCDAVTLPIPTLHGLEPHEHSIYRHLHSSAADFIEKFTPPPEAGAFKRKAALQLAQQETAIAHGLRDGTSTMLIDLSRCTQCNDCVTACASTHDGIPRFARTGKTVGTWLIAETCRHCHDPKCLSGCPNSAISLKFDRREANARVSIDQDVCLGCGACAAHCPHHGIALSDTGFLWRNQDAEYFEIAGLTGEERLVAHKCDNCSGRAGGQACVNACPVGCLVRVADAVNFLKKD